MENPITLEELVPQSTTVHLASTGKDYVVRKFSLDDEIWLREKYGDRLQEILTNLKINEICEIFFHQLEDKDDFVAKEVTFVNEETGDKSTGMVGGVKLLKMMISGMQEKQEICTAIMHTIGISRERQKDLAGLVASPSAEKKRPSATGQRSSTPSRTSMVGRKSTSSAAQGGKSTTR